MTMINEAIKRQVKEEEKRIRQALIDSGLDPVTRVSMGEFERVFLPLLANIGEDFQVAAWVKEVSHPFVRLEVYSEDKLMFNIPPLLDQQETTGLNNDRFSNHIDIIRSHTSDNPRLGMNYMVNLLDQCSDRHYDGYNSAINLAVALNKVFSYYNMPLLPLPETAANTKAKESAPAELLIVGEEDF